MTNIHVPVAVVSPLLLKMVALPWRSTMFPVSLLLCVILMLQLHVVAPITAFSAWDHTLYDFTSPAISTANWEEVSDTVREVGMSKATLDIVPSKAGNQRAVFFSLLNPQPDGACFAGMVDRFSPSQNWSGVRSVRVNARAQGSNSVYKIILNDGNHASGLAFEHVFAVVKGEQFNDYSLDLSDFVCSFRGRPCPDNVLDVTNIASFGFQMAGGVYDSYKQTGVSSLEISRVHIRSY